MKNEYLLHTVATIAYRFKKIIMDADNTFGNFSLGEGSRSSNEIINHMFHVLSSTRLFILEGNRKRELPEKLNLKLEIERFNEEIISIKTLLAKEELEIDFTKRLLQGPFSDILTHIGQIAMLSRLYGNPIAREDFSSATIRTEIE